VYREIMSASLALEKDLRIAYLGPEATFTHQAARAKFGASVAYEPQGSISEVFESVVRGRADYGVVPVENSWEGAVNLTLDMFSESDLQVCAQILMRIEHRLLANGPKELIRKVYSHPQAFGQCRRWLQMHLPRAEWVEVSSTTRAVELAAREEGAAAVAGRLAGELYGVPTLEGGIQDSAENTTRFLVIGQKASPATGADRTSLMFTVPHRPGALYRALECFDRFGINIGKIESRPSRKKAWEYCFFLDVDGHASDSGLGEALEALAAHCTVVKILGTFPQASEVE
jgi:chorismate mutase/prephenate dehydratase